MTHPTYSNNQTLIDELETWGDSECFPKQKYCPFEGNETSTEYLSCSTCPFYPDHRDKFINQLKVLNLLELNDVPVSEITETNEERK